MSTNFDTLWANHPGRDAHPCVFENQCAIRMGVCLEKSGIDTSSFTGVRCWHGHSPGHILRAQELANWLESKSDLFGHSQKSFSSSIVQGKRGILFIQNGWSGGVDHIDLWDGKKRQMIGGELDYLKLGEQVWFWELG